MLNRFTSTANLVKIAALAIAIVVVLLFSSLFTALAEEGSGPFAQPTPTEDAGEVSTPDDQATPADAEQPVDVNEPPQEPTAPGDAAQMPATPRAPSQPRATGARSPPSPP